MFGTEVESEMVGRFKVSVYYDTDLSLADAVNDEPCMIFEVDHSGYGWTFAKVLDQSAKRFPALEVLHDLARARDDSRVLDTLCDMPSLTDWGQVGAGKFWGEHAEWTRRRYYKTRGALVAALMRAEYGCDLSDLRLESFRSTVYQNGDDYVLAFWQSELDAYAGVKGAKSSLDSCQSIVDGDVYGFVISGHYDADGDRAPGFADHLDSCWGFIGDSDDCLSEGKSAAEWLEKKAAERDAVAFADDLMTARPDLAPQWAGV